MRRPKSPQTTPPQRTPSRSLGAALSQSSRSSRAVSDTPYLEALHQVTSSDPNVVCVTCSDVARAYLESSPNRIPQSLVHLPTGVSAAVTFCAGLASEGYRPFLHASAAALTRAGYEAIVNQISAPRLPVRLIGFDAGLSHHGGVAAQAIDDLSLLDLPNFTLAEPGDAEDILGGLSLLNAVSGPVYFRVTQGQAPRLFDGPPKLGEPRVLSEGQDILVISAGQCTAEVLRLADTLSRARVSLTHLHCFTLKPLPRRAISDLINRGKYKGVITLEAHLARGGLGTMVTELICDEVDADKIPKIYRLGLQDSFAQGGSRGYLFKKYGVDVGALIAAVESILKRKLGLGASELPPSPWGNVNDAPPVR